MKLKRAFVVGLFSLTVVILTALYLNISSKAGKFSMALHRILASSGISSIDLSRVEKFQWDELYVFGPYTDRESNCRTLSINWIACRWLFPAVVDEGKSILAFKSGGEVVHVGVISVFLEMTLPPKCESHS